jgi:hypothetical protein
MLRQEISRAQPADTAPNHYHVVISRHRADAAMSHILTAGCVVRDAVACEELSLMPGM